MGREIKFRAFDKRNKSMTAPYVLDYRASYRENEFIMVQTPDPQGIAWGNTKEHIELMQFTGVRDKNGKEIYEGDIVAIDYARGRVVFAAGCFMIEWLLDDPEPKMEWLGVYHKPDQPGKPREDIEVVGNIYEIPPK
jgi:hypothetical protein